VLAPGIGSLAELLALRSRGGASSHAALELPSPAALPANERRRASQAVRLTLACAEQALRDSPFAADTLRMVFASDEGTGEVCQQMLETLATTRQVSPLLFHNSVHNAPSGYFSIGYRNRQSATSVSLGAQSFASGLLCAASEASVTGQPVLLLAYDPAMTGPMNALLPVVQATATAWVIDANETTAQSRSVLGSFELSLHAAAGDAGAALPAWLPATWAANSSVQSLTALAMLGDSETRTCELRLGAQMLRIARVSGGPAC
jgi:hypothetical protein